MLMIYLGFMIMIETKSKSDIKILKMSYKTNIDATQLRICPNRSYLYKYYGPKHGLFSRVCIPASNDCRTNLSNIKYYLHMTKLIRKTLRTFNLIY